MELTPPPTVPTTTARGPLMPMPGATVTAADTAMAVTAVMVATGTARGPLMLTPGATDTAAPTAMAVTDTAASATTDKRVLGTHTSEMSSNSPQHKVSLILADKYPHSLTSTQIPNTHLLAIVFVHKSFLSSCLFKMSSF